MKQACEFRVQDVLAGMPEERFDLISCRYAVFLYLSWEEGAAVLKAMVENCMAPGCVLVIGPSEELPRGYQQLGLSPLLPSCPGCYKLRGGRGPSAGGPVWAGHRTFEEHCKSAGGGSALAAAERLNVKVVVEEAAKLTATQLAGFLSKHDSWEEKRRARLEAAREAVRLEEDALCKPPKCVSNDRLAAMLERMKPKARASSEPWDWPPSRKQPARRPRTGDRKPRASPLGRPSAAATTNRRPPPQPSSRLLTLSQPGRRSRAASRNGQSSRSEHSAATAFSFAHGKPAADSGGRYGRASIGGLPV